MRGGAIGLDRNHGAARRWRPFLGLFATVLLGVAQSAVALAYTLYPAADTYVRQNSPNSNYGASSTLRIRNMAASGRVAHSRVDPTVRFLPERRPGGNAAVFE